MAQKLSIIMPAYNEERTIHLILDKVKDVELVNGMERKSSLRMIAQKMIPKVP